MVEAQGKALIEQKVELEAGAQARVQEMGALRQEVTRLRERLQGDTPQGLEEPPPQPPSPAQEALCDEEGGGLDQKDPNRPRFTLQELRDVLHERNELKAKVFMLQEEIAYYKRQPYLFSPYKQNMFLKKNIINQMRLTQVVRLNLRS